MSDGNVRVLGLRTSNVKGVGRGDAYVRSVSK